MSDRLASGMLVSALIRRVNAAGGFATVLAKGDDTAGAILVLTRGQGEYRAYERGLGGSGATELLPVKPQDDGSERALSDYWQRRHARDSDLWVVELDIADAERFAAETILPG